MQLNAMFPPRDIGNEPARIREWDRWRVCFRFENGDAFDVEIVDYH